MSCRVSLAVAAVALLAASADGYGADSRLRSAVYEVDRVYALRGYVGYQIDLEFEAGEAFVGIGAGDLQAIGYAAQDNHLFIKPKAVRVRTNLTVLTTRRSYHFDYEVVSAAPPDGLAAELVFVLRFNYPSKPTKTIDSRGEDLVAADLDRAAEAQAPNRNYWYCGSPTLQPLSAFDDGVRTHLRFDPRRELPAVFIRNDDRSESLINFNVEQGEVIIHRVAERLVVRRGALQGCIVNRGFAATGHDLRSGTVTPRLSEPHVARHHER